MKIAVACFVKTPGLSPIKTRLAAEVGTVKAAKVYEACCKLMEESLRLASLTHPDIQPYWAVAELAGLKHEKWSRLKTVFQGDGALGLRLKTVYDQLLENHDAVIVTGADCPLLAPSLIVDAAQILNSKEAVIGLTSDGGYYLFGSRVNFDRDVELNESVWQKTPYSTLNTALSFLENLRLAGVRNIEQLPELNDLDVKADLLILKSTLDLDPKNKFAIEAGWANQLKAAFHDLLSDI
jgi:glycosyltransferase A (GT-A) superfamily protein (DUF2064 family)